MQYIDLHTHKIKAKDKIQLITIFAQDLPKISPDYPFSSGIHPWHIEKIDVEACIAAIEQACKLKNMLAIGECGLDRSISTLFSLQESCFQKHVALAEKHAKPLIIHCVRSYSDLIKAKKTAKSQVPWIIHGYHANLETTLNLIKHDFYFSVGEQLLNDHAKLESFQKIPDERLFLETDDRPISIEFIYSKAAQLLKIEEELLAQRICNNFKSVFGVSK